MVRGVGGFKDEDEVGAVAKGMRFEEWVEGEDSPPLGLVEESGNLRPCCREVVLAAAPLPEAVADALEFDLLNANFRLGARRA